MPDNRIEFDDFLVAQLREERPQIDPAFARELDTRAAAGFSKPRRRFALPRWRGIPAFVPATGLALVVAAVVVANLPTGAGDDDATSGSSTAGGAAASLAAPKQSAGSTDESAGVAAPPSVARSPEVPGGRDRVQEQSASMTLLAPPKEVAEVGDRILGVADQVGGFVVSSNVRATDGTSGGGDFQLRVPTARLDDALARLSRLGHVRERQQGVQDITSERNSARAQFEEAGAERRSLLRRLATADTDNEVTSLRARLRDVNAMIASYQDALTRVNRRAQYAAVSVSLLAQPKQGAVTPPDDGSWTPGDAARDALRVLEVAAGVLLLIVAVLAPLALLGGAAVAGRRFSGRRGRERALDAI